MPRVAVCVAFALCACSSPPLPSRPPLPPRLPPERALALLRSFAGEWQGTYRWEGGRSDRGEMAARYYVTGNGTAVVEDLIERQVPVMTTVYHLDGADLRMTHFGGTGNQPRLRATAIDVENRRLAFAFVDITNAASADAPHVDGFELSGADGEHLALVFHFSAGGKASIEHIDLVRTH